MKRLIALLARIIERIKDHTHYNAADNSASGRGTKALEAVT